MVVEAEPSKFDANDELAEIVKQAMREGTDVRVYVGEPGTGERMAWDIPPADLYATLEQARLGKAFDRALERAFSKATR